jgi:hypothetical protein
VLRIVPKAELVVVAVGGEKVVLFRMLNSPLRN